MNELQSLILKNAYDHYVETNTFDYCCTYPPDIQDCLRYGDAIQYLSDNGYVTLCGRPAIGMRIIRITDLGISYISCS